MAQGVREPLARRCARRPRTSSSRIWNIWRCSTRIPAAGASGCRSGRWPNPERLNLPVGSPGVARSSRVPRRPLSATLARCVRARLPVSDARRLPQEDPDREGVRRGDRVAARPRADAVRAARQSHPAQARGPAAGVLLQAARRVQQDGASVRRGAARGVIAASAGNHAQGVALAAAAPRLRGHHRHAGDHAAHQDRGGRARGAEVVLHGDSYFDGACPRAQRCRSVRGRRSSIPTTIPTSSRARARSAWRSCASMAGAIDADLRRRSAAAGSSPASPPT